MSLGVGGRGYHHQDRTQPGREGPPSLQVPAVPHKSFSSADCDTIYTIYPYVQTQLMRTIFEGRPVLELRNKNKRIIIFKNSKIM